MDSFECNLKSPPVIFGTGTLSQLPAELSRLGSVRPLILSTPQQAQQAARVSTVLSDKTAGTFSKARMHTPINVTQEALDLVLAGALPGSGGDAIKGLNSLLNRAKIGRSLNSLGMKESDIDKVADLAVSAPYWNLRDINRSTFRELIRRAWAGEEARSDF